MPSVDLSPETLARLEAQLQADLDAVRRVRALLAAPKIPARPSPALQPSVPAEEKIAPAPAMAPSAPAAAPSAQAVPPPPAYVPPPPTSVAVPQAVALMEGEFGTKALKAVLAREHLGGHPDPEIRRVLNRMVKSGELRVATVSAGRGGSTYQRVAKG